jgi:hypothetical protein
LLKLVNGSVNYPNFKITTYVYYIVYKKYNHVYKIIVCVCYFTMVKKMKNKK